MLKHFNHSYFIIHLSEYYYSHLNKIFCSSSKIAMIVVIILLYIVSHMYTVAVQYYDFE